MFSDSFYRGRGGDLIFFFFGYKLFIGEEEGYKFLFIDFFVFVLVYGFLLVKPFGKKYLIIHLIHHHLRLL